MSGPLEMALVVAAPGALALLPALLLLRRGRPWLGFLAGVGVILAVQMVLQVRLRMEVEACAERVCRLITDSSACQAASFGCYEWTGLAALFYLVAAVVGVLGLAAACAVAEAMRRKRSPSPVAG